MSLQTVSIDSSPSPLPGQDNRSSGNFVFSKLPVPPNKIFVKISETVEIMPGVFDLQENTNISCAMMWDRPAQRDPVKTALKSRSLIDPAILETGNDYYVASPNGATSSFTVSFIANVPD